MGLWTGGEGDGMRRTPAERCMDCLLDVTHTLRWTARDQAWRICKFSASTVRPWNTRKRYCRWHAIVHATQRNARGIVPRKPPLQRVGQAQAEESQL
jgi:hypothetical protein